MSTGAVDALLETAADGISFDGISVERDSDGYRFETSETSREGLTSAQLRRLARDHPAVSNWYFWHATAPQRQDHWAWLRWVEGLDGTAQPSDSVVVHYDRLEDGLVRVWGQLHVTVTASDEPGVGRREYTVRHVQDAGRHDLDADAVDDTPFDRYDDPIAIRDLARVDDRDRYRPLKTAPTLRRGWEFQSLSAAALLTLVEYCYPATVPNWFREREGSLDVTHWREAVDRQTGIYRVVKRWDRGEGHQHVEWVADACCADSQCLKRRVWQYDGETTLESDGGVGQFPCREPCSLVIAAARRFIRLEAAESRTYEFELTPSEKGQIESIIDAVAEGRTADIREAEFADPANRYRARFLRAKRFDGAGFSDRKPDSETREGTELNSTEATAPPEADIDDPDSDDLPSEPPD